MMNEYFALVRKRCAEYGIDPNQIPSFDKVSTEELIEIQEKYSETLSVIKIFISQFLSKTKGIPLLVTVTDDKGTFIEYMGDETLQDTIVKLAGLQKGIQFTERKAGVSSVLAAIELKKPIQILGTEHYHHFLHSAACYSAPLYVNDRLIGTISVMTFLDFAHPMILTTLETVVDSIKRELDLREENRYLDEMNKMMLEHSSIGYIVTEESGKILNVNSKAKAILSGTKIEQHYIQEITPLNEIYNRFKQGDMIQNYEIIIENSKNLVCLVDCFPFQEGTLIQLHDITEYKKTEAYIQNTEKLTIVGQLAAGVAHEIKNPLTTLKGFIQLMQQNLYSETYTPVMLKEIERINEITNEFLVLSRPTVLSKELNDIKKLFVEIEVLLSSIGILKNIDFVKNFKDVPSIYCDGNQLKQVFINIFKNSVEALDHNGQVHLTVDLHNSHHIMIRFEDHGKGFPDHILTKLGQPFVTTKENGNGLGIMVCKRIIETIHMGQLNMYNKANNTGAVVEIILPISTD
ncbi:ATP-binding protein [Alkalihalobacterium elongatum]|uniref:ATP-binding protein n=1 Tax=Alkalihalobacterium elongatum TaxID=2675466 RepID=UPI001C1F2134|nr:ATP-binding protein [Alkalihalobacterium elongatum]